MLAIGVLYVELLTTNVLRLKLRASLNDVCSHNNWVNDEIPTYTAALSHTQTLIATDT